MTKKVELMQDKTVLITGGNAGIGKATVRKLANRGAEVVMACRDMEKAEAAAEEIIKHSGNGQVSVIHCDLSSFDSIRKAVGEFTAGHQQLDVLINNAGVVTSDLHRTEEGFELQFGVNHLGHFLLTKLLLNHLKKAAKPRVVTVASHSHYRGEIDFNNLRGQKGNASYHGMEAYGQSKLANVLFARELARRHPWLDSNSLHPGVVRTSLGNKATNWYYSLFWTLYKPFMINNEKGADTSFYLAASPEVEGVSGQYFDDKQRRKHPSRLAQDPELARRLWEVSEQYVAEYGLQKS